MPDARAPRFSVIIPARNMDRFLAETLDSVLAQSEPSYEVICVNDGSTDGTADIIDDYAGRDARVQRLDGPCKGVSAARNAGLDRARGELMVFLDGDDLLSRDALAQFASCLDASDAEMSIGGIERISEDGRALPGQDNRLIIPANGHLEALLKKNYIVNGGAVAIRRVAAKEAGGYDTTLVNGEDWEFWCRIGLRGDFAVMDGPAVLKYRQVSTGANFRTQDSVFARKVKCLQAILDNPDFQDAFGPRLKRLVRARRIDSFWSGVRNRYQHGQKSRALLTGIAGIFLYPDSIARPRLIMRFFGSLAR